MQIFYVGENMKIYFCKTIKRNPIHALISGGVGCILKFLGKEMMQKHSHITTPSWKIRVHRGTMINLMMMLLQFCCCSCCFAIGDYDYDVDVDDGGDVDWISFAFDIFCSWLWFDKHQCIWHFWSPSTTWMKLELNRWRCFH